MTYEKLLETIDEVGYCLENGHTLLKTEIIEQIKALRAVVELHKPFPNLVDEYEQGCEECSRWTKAAVIFYPCSTIEAIEKELQ